MSQLPPDLARLLEDAQRTHGPSASDRERVLARLHASLGMVPVLTPDMAAASQPAPTGLEAPMDLPSFSAPAAGTGLPLASGLPVGKTAVLGKTVGTLLKWKAGKMLLASLALGGAVGASVSLPSSEPEAHPRTVEASLATSAAPDDDHEERAPVERPAKPTRRERASRRHEERASSRDEARVSARSRARAARDESKPASAPVAVSEAQSDDTDWLRLPTEVESAAEAARARAAASAPQREATKPVEESTRAPTRDAPTQPPRAQLGPERAVEELGLIRRALTSLRDHDPKRALALLNEHASDYPEGAFATERRGLRVVALCAAGHVEQGREERSAFLHKAGTSPVAERVRRACRDDGGSSKP